MRKLSDLHYVNNQEKRLQNHTKSTVLRQSLDHPHRHCFLSPPQVALLLHNLQTIY